MRDPQKLAVYRAEEKFLATNIEPDASLDQLQTWAGEIQNLEYWKQRSPHRRSIIVRLSDKAYSQAQDGGLFVVLGIHGRNRQTLLHEMAHVLNRRISLKRQDHGPEFMGILLGLWEEWMDPQLLKSWLVIVLEEQGISVAPSV